MDWLRVKRDRTVAHESFSLPGFLVHTLPVSKLMLRVKPRKASSLRAVARPGGEVVGTGVVLAPTVGADGRRLLNYDGFCQSSVC